jgi:hypothetical protein
MSTRELVAWASANLPRDRTIFADPVAGSLLEAAGFTDVRRDVSTCRAGGFVFVTALVRQRAERQPSVAACLASSLLDVSVGTGGTVAELRGITADPAAAAAVRAEALADRRLGGAALADNPAISMSAEVRRELRAGRLDLRAEAVLALLAGRAPIRIAAIRGYAGELRAGLPARTVAIRLAQPARFDALLAHISRDYRPSDIVRRLRVEQLTWPFRTEPLPVLA